MYEGNVSGCVGDIVIENIVGNELIFFVVSFLLLCPIPRDL